MKTAYFWLTPQGKQLAEQLQAHFGGTVEPKADFAEAVRRAFADCDALVFVMATGIVVRTIAPLVQSKASDPAVLVLDQRGKHVISLLSGHLGGANAMAEQAAAYLGGEAVITTATDVEHVPAFDLFAKENHLTIENLEELKYISGALVAGEPVSLCTAFPVEKNAFRKRYRYSLSPKRPRMPVLWQLQIPRNLSRHPMCSICGRKVWCWGWGAKSRSRRHIWNSASGRFCRSTTSVFRQWKSWRPLG